MNKLLINLVISRVIFVIIALSNLFLPLYPDKLFNANLFEFVVILIWGYGLLSHLGYFKQQVSADEDGIIRYECSVPIIQIGFVRLAQIGYYLVRSVTISWVSMIILLALDIIYIAFILLDKANYYYESEKEE